MLSKLLKYEFRATALYFLPIYIALLVVSGFSAVVHDLAMKVQSPLVNRAMVLFASLYGLLAISLAVTTFVVIVLRFYKHLLGNEGYLMFTLPVTAEQNILAKLIPAVTWFMGSCMLGILTIIPVFLGGYKEAVDFFFSGESFSFADTAEWLIFLFLCFVGAVIGLATTFLFYYFCMIVGQTFNSHKFLASVVTYLVLQGVFQVIGILSVFTLISLVENMTSGSLLWRIANWVPLNDGNAGFFILGGMAFADVIALAVAVGVFFLDSTLLRKKLNLT